MRFVLKWFGIFSIVVGVSICAYVLFELFGTDVITNNNNNEETNKVEQVWSQRSEIEPGFNQTSKTINENKNVIIKIPKFGNDYKWLVRNGTDTETLRKGPGHYVNSGVLGKPGNYGIAGHRTTYGAPFKKLDILENGDFIKLETWNKIYIYEVYTKLYVHPKAVFVLDKSELSEITLTTCHPEFSSSQRLIIKAILVSTIKKT